MSDKVAAALGPDVRAARARIDLGWQDPANYDARVLCERCGRDALRWYWPLCADTNPETGEKYTHAETCARYGEHSWLCPLCEQIMDEELD